MKQSQKLPYLLRLLWNSPVFGDSYPPTVFEDTTLLQMENIYNCFAAKFRPILSAGMLHASIAEVNEILGQIAPKSIAFCSAISAGEINDTESLCAVAVAIAVSYWADQSIDRGDEAMLAAVRHVNVEIQKGVQLTYPASELVGARIRALRHIERQLRKANDNPEDLPYMLQAICNDVLANQAHMRELSRQYLTDGGSPDFWDRYAEDVARTTAADSGLMSAVTVVYAIYRQYQPHLPSLSEIYQNEEIMELVNGLFNSSVRLFDDWGDRKTDSGRDSKWGIFNINIFNQSDPKFLDRFMRYSGIEDAALRSALMSAFIRADATSRTYVTEVYLGLLREQFTRLPSPLWERYAIFLGLCKRTLEAGIVNSIGDFLLSEDKEMHMVETGILRLITSSAPEDYQAINDGNKE